MGKKLVKLRRDYIGNKIKGSVNGTPRANFKLSLSNDGSTWTSGSIQYVEGNVETILPKNLTDNVLRNFLAEGEDGKELLLFVNDECTQYRVDYEYYVGEVLHIESISGSFN